MGCGKSKASSNKQLEQALQRIAEKEKALEDLIQHHEKLNQISTQNAQTKEKYQKNEALDELKETLNLRFSKLEKNLEKIGQDAVRLSNQNGEIYNKQSSHKSPSIAQQQFTPLHNNNILNTEDIQFNSKQGISTPPVPVSPNQLTHNQQLQKQISSSYQPKNPSPLQLQHQPSLQQQTQSSQQYFNQQQFFNQQQSSVPSASQHHNTKHKKGSSRGIKDEYEMAGSSQKRISIGQNGKIIKSQKQAADQVEDEMQNWNNLIQAFDDVSIRQIDQQEIPHSHQNPIHLEVLEYESSSQQQKNGKQKSNHIHNNNTKISQSQSASALQSKASAPNSKDATLTSNNNNNKSKGVQ